MTGPDAPAFPEIKVYAYHCIDEKHQGAWTPPVTVGHGGLTKREYFAGLAMQCLTEWDAIVNQHSRQFAAPETIGRTAVTMADALIAALVEAEKIAA